MTQERLRELKQIAAHLYVTVLDEMGTHKWGHVKGGVEETIILAELSKKINLDMTNWLYQDLTEGDDTNEKF